MSTSGDSSVQRFVQKCFKCHHIIGYKQIENTMNRILKIQGYVCLDYLLINHLVFYIQCELISHKKCLKKMTIMCAKAPLPPKSDVLNLDLSKITDEVPVLLVKCTLEIERRGCMTPGIYRMTGVSSRVQKILKSFESGPHLIDVSDVSPNDLCSVLKVFLREVCNALFIFNQRSPSLFYSPSNKAEGEDKIAHLFFENPRSIGVQEFFP